jgi:hypothetical protein
MIRFPHSPKISFIADGKAVLEEDFYFDVTVKGKKYQIVIKSGLIFDGASIPRACWRVAGHPYQYPLLACALPHDILYATELFKQSECDWIFLLLMQLVGIGWLKRNVVYSAVRCFGWIVWKKHTDKSIEDAKAYIRITEVNNVKC